MSWFVSYVRSSIGAKQMMAVTGLGLLLFAIVHMVGHLGMFAGRDHYDDYAHTLQNLGGGEIKWVIRAGLLGLLALHVATAIGLSRGNAAARPHKYQVVRYARTSIFARTMLYTGLVIFVFIGFHICHFTLGWIQPADFHQLDDKGRYDAYGMFVAGFHNPAILVFYVAATSLLSAHLAHGASSWFQSLGLRHPRYDAMIDKVGPVLGVVLAIGYAAPPIAVALHLIR